MVMSRDLKDGQPWSTMEVVALRHLLAWGESIEEAARFLRRCGTVNEVEQKAKELSLRASDCFDDAELN
jgi:hypothetical protein